MKNKVGVRIIVPHHVALNIWRNKSCQYKEYRHHTAASAQSQINQLERRGLAPVGTLHVYSCQFCGGYHVGHQMKTA
jgi:hypothetical protein